MLPGKGLHDVNTSFITICESTCHDFMPKAPHVMNLCQKLFSQRVSHMIYLQLASMHSVSHAPLLPSHNPWCRVIQSKDNIS